MSGKPGHAPVFYCTDMESQLRHALEAKGMQTQPGQREREAGPGTASWVAELGGWLIAFALSAFCLTQLVAAQAEFIFSDGDSVLPVMIVRSIGEPQDWALSPVLFIPETLVFAMLSLLRLSTQMTMLLNGIVSVLALYGSLRLVAGRRTNTSSPVGRALLAFGLFCSLLILETVGAGTGYQLASLLGILTYYYPVVIATVLTVGIVSRAQRTTTGHLLVSSVAVGFIAAVSTLNNPLFVLWGLVPVCCGYVLVMLNRRTVILRLGCVVGALIAGAVLGYALRGFFSNNIVADSVNYFRPWAAEQSILLFGGLLDDTVRTPAGMIWLALIAGMMVVAVFSAVHSWKAHDCAALLVSSVAIVSPMLTTIVLIGLGSDAPRYLQPWAFMPLLGILAIRFDMFGRVETRLRRRNPNLTITVVVGLVAIAALGQTRIVVTRATDPDLQCVVRWVDQSERTGAGQFWTVRGPKAYIADTSRLLQVDNNLQPYDWLINRAETPSQGVTFLLTGPRDTPFVLPPELTDSVRNVLPCGRFTILDFGATELRGTPRN